MAESGLRAHIYLTVRPEVEFATRQKPTDRPLETRRPAEAGQPRSRRATASRDRTAELAHAHAPARPS